MKQKRSDQSVAIYGLECIAVAALVGGVYLLSLGREGGTELIALAAMIGTGILGWSRGGTYYDSTPEVVPGPEVAEPAKVKPPLVSFGEADKPVGQD